MHDLSALIFEQQKNRYLKKRKKAIMRVMSIIVISIVFLVTLLSSIK